MTEDGYQRETERMLAREDEMVAVVEQEDRTTYLFYVANVGYYRVEENRYGEWIGPAMMGMHHRTELFESHTVSWMPLEDAPGPVKTLVRVGSQ